MPCILVLEGIENVLKSSKIKTYFLDELDTLVRSQKDNHLMNNYRTVGVNEWTSDHSYMQQT